MVGIYSPIEGASVFDVMRAWAGLVGSSCPGMNGTMDSVGAIRKVIMSLGRFTGQNVWLIISNYKSQKKKIISNYIEEYVR